MIKTVGYSKFLYQGILPNHRAYPIDHNLHLFAADTETFKGRPMTLQAWDGESFTLFKYVTPSTIFPELMGYLYPRCRQRGVNVCYFHYLKFDLPIIFYEKRLDMYEQVSDIHFKYHGWDCELLFGKVNTASIRGKGIKLMLFDSYAFTQAGLDASLKMYKIPFEKHPRPKRIGRVNYKSLKPADPERVEFEKYAKQDVTSLWHLGRSIMNFHKKYTVRPSISLPQFAARVFRHHFFKPSERIEFPRPLILKASEASYHGGKNGYYLDKPSVVEDVYEIDISSAFPHAMSQIPQMMRGYYAPTKTFKPDYAGVYKISGFDKGTYPIIFDHGFRPVDGVFKNIWITGYELARALKAPWVSLEILKGWVWIHDRHYKHNPLAEYVQHFYKLKETTPKADAGYYFYKTMMNALYGKFVQTTEIRKVELVEDGKPIGVDYTYDSVLKKFVKSSTEFRAGGMYNPFLASQITGYVRGYLYDLETKYHALHSATDAIKTTHKVAAIKGLGGLKVEAFGRCYFFRNKLYLHFSKDFSHCGHDPKTVRIWDGNQHLCKFALHGFKGTAEDLWQARHKLLRGETFKYRYDHMVGLREGLRRGEEPCNMVERIEEVRL